MTQINQIQVLIPSLVGAITIACTILIHALALNVTLSFIRREKKRGRAGASYWIDTAIVSLATSFMLVAHLIEVALWAALFQICGEFSTFGSAYYHSAVNYTTLGYGDVIMSLKWRLLGPLEAANGALMFGLSTAIIFALIQMLIQVRYIDPSRGR
jgi:hypothetical protein